MGHPTMQENDTAKLTPTLFVHGSSGKTGIFQEKRYNCL